MDSIAVATSIPPRMSRLNAGREMGEAYQDLCVRSWIENGFRVVSINHPDEIPDLAARFPDVEFIATERSARKWTGRDNPYIADLLQALTKAPEKVLGIVNADILFERSPEWKARLPSLIDGAIVIGQRCNTSSLQDGVFLRYLDGVDCFFFDRSFAEAAAPIALPFAMGLPWWDIWLPYLAVIRNRRVLVVDRPAIAHLVHSQGFEKDHVREFSVIFAGKIIDECDHAAHALPDAVLDAIPLCREVAAASDGSTTSSALHRVAAGLAAYISSFIRDTVVQFGSTPSDDAFHRLEERLAAGAALLQADRLSKEGKWEPARRAALAALEGAPDDHDVLTCLAAIAIEQRDFDAALPALSKAAALKPESTRVLALIGRLLRGQAKRQEAVICFRYLACLNPDLPDAYKNLAVVLLDAGRRDEADLRLKRAISHWPEFTPAFDLYQSMRKDQAVGLPVIRSLGGTGGTLVAQLFSALPDMVCLSETNPRSANLHGGALNPLLQLQKWHPDFARGMQGFHPYELGYPPQFGKFLERLQSVTQARGYQLILRDYNYADCIGVPYVWPVPDDSSLDLAVDGRFVIQDLLLVRHPADQLASLRKHEAVRQVLTASLFLDGYRRFLGAWPRSPVFRYEDLVAAPEETFRKMCACLGVAFDGRALLAFSKVSSVTGNLDRLSEDRIVMPERSAAAHRAEEELSRLPEYGDLLKKLGYEGRQAR